MGDEPGNGNTIAYRLTQVERALILHEERAVPAITLLHKHDEQINGDRGLSKAVDALTDEIRTLRRALWGAAIAVSVSAIGFAITVIAMSGSNS